MVTAEPTIAPDIPVAVLNGTSTSGLAARASETLAAGGVLVGLYSNADANDIHVVTVVLRDGRVEGAARGVAQLLPGADVRLEEFAEVGMQLVSSSPTTPSSSPVEPVTESLPFCDHS